MAGVQAGGRRLGMALVGPGFVGVHHVEAVRRFGFVDVVAVADFSEESAARHAKALHAKKAYGSYEELMKDPEVDVVHVTTPNYLHAPVIRAAIANGKHVVSEKPLAMSSAEARELLDAAKAAGVVHAVTFNYRGNPMVQHARDMVAKGEIGPVHFVHGNYIQDWLQHPTDYSWRLEPAQGGRSSAFADIGSHWCDLAQHLIGARIESVLAELTTVLKTRLRPTRATNAFSGAAADVPREEVTIACEDLGSVLLRFENGAKGSMNVGQVLAGHKNDFWLELSGRKGSLRWHQEQQNELWFGSRDAANQVITKDPGLLSDVGRQYTHLPGGHQQGWPDAFTNLLRDVYDYIAAGGPATGHAAPAMATFADGLRAASIIDAVLESHDAGGVWTKVKA